MPEEKKPVTPPAVPEEVTIDDIKSIIQTAVKDCTKEEIDALKKEINGFQMKQVFPGGDGTDTTSVDDDVVLDTTFFTKNYADKYSGHIDPKLEMQYPWLRSGMALGKQLCEQGRPFRRLNKAMDKFATFIKAKGNLNGAQQRGVDMIEYGNDMKAHYKQAGLNEGALADGGVFAPPEWGATVIEFATQQSWLLSQVWRYPMNSNILRLPKLVQAAGNYFGGIQFYTPGEGELKESTKPVFEQMTWEAKKLIAVCYLTDELIYDSNINIINYITGLFVRAFQYEMERRVIAGLGGAANGPCLGIINDPGINVVTRQTAGTITIQDILNLDASLDESFNNLVWITRKATQITLMNIRDNQNRPVFISDYGVFTAQRMHPTTMISYPVHYTRNVPSIGEKGDIILGDPSWYLLAMRQDLKIDQTEYVRWLYDETALRFVMRFDGAPAVPIAFSVLDAES
jgi:HK97 family phage major capsid protein